MDNNKNFEKYRKMPVEKLPLIIVMMLIVLILSGNFSLIFEPLAISCQICFGQVVRSREGALVVAL